MKHVICFLAFLIAADAVPAEVKQPAAEETPIHKVLHDQVAAWNQGDLAVASSQIDENAQ